LPSPETWCGHRGLARKNRQDAHQVPGKKGRPGAEIRAWQGRMGGTRTRCREKGETWCGHRGLARENGRNAHQVPGERGDLVRKSGPGKGEWAGRAPGAGRRNARCPKRKQGARKGTPGAWRKPLGIREKGQLGSQVPVWARRWGMGRDWQDKKRQATLRLPVLIAIVSCLAAMMLSGGGPELSARDRSSVPRSPPCFLQRYPGTP